MEMKKIKLSLRKETDKGTKVEIPETKNPGVDFGPVVKEALTWENSQTTNGVVNVSKMHSNGFLSQPRSLPGNKSERSPEAKDFIVTKPLSKQTAKVHQCPRCNNEVGDNDSLHWKDCLQQFRLDTGADKLYSLNKQEITKSLNKEKTHHCPFCWKLLTSKNQTEHLKLCGKQNGFSPDQIIEVVEMMKRHAKEGEALGLTTPHLLLARRNAKRTAGRKIKNMFPKSAQEADLQMALALSASLETKEDSNVGFPSASSAENLSKKNPRRAVKNQKEKFSHLVTCSQEKRQQIIASNIARILGSENESKRVQDSSVEQIFLPAQDRLQITEKPKNYSNSGTVVQGNPLWNLASLPKEEWNETNTFYVPLLEHVVTPSRVKVGSKFKRLSQIPGRGSSQADPQTKKVSKPFLAPPFDQSLDVLVGNLKFSDIRFVTRDGSIIPAHRLILYARCPKLFQDVENNGTWDKADQKPLTVDWHSVSYTAGWSFLRYIYTGIMPDGSLAKEIYHLAERYEVSLQDFLSHEEHNEENWNNSPCMIVSPKSHSVSLSADDDDDSELQCFTNAVKSSVVTETLGDKSCVDEKKENEECLQNKLFENILSESEENLGWQNECFLETSTSTPVRKTSNVNVGKRFSISSIRHSSKSGVSSDAMESWNKESNRNSDFEPDSLDSVTRSPVFSSRRIKKVLKESNEVVKESIVTPEDFRNNVGEDVYDGSGNIFDDEVKQTASATGIVQSKVNVSDEDSPLFDVYEQRANSKRYKGSPSLSMSPTLPLFKDNNSPVTTGGRIPNGILKKNLNASEHCDDSTLPQPAEHQSSALVWEGFENGDSPQFDVDGQRTDSKRCKVSPSLPLFKGNSSPVTMGERIPNVNLEKNLNASERDDDSTLPQPQASGFQSPALENVWEGFDDGAYAEDLSHGSVELFDTAVPMTCELPQHETRIDESSSLQSSLPESNTSKGKKGKEKRLKGKHKPQKSKRICQTVTPKPDYDQMETPQISKELKKYGIRKFPRKKAVAILEHVYEGTHPLVTDSEQDLSVLSNTSRSPVLDCFPHRSEDCEAASSQRSLPSSQTSSIASQGSSGHASGNTEDLQKELYSFFTSDPNLYTKVLCYELLEFDDLYNKVRAAGIKLSERALMDYMDDKGINFTMRHSHLRKQRWKPTRKKKTKD